MKYVAWLVLLVACTDFEAVTRDVCGNGLLEAGEDCDSSDPSCVSCSVSCSADADCPSASYRCGIDGLCHAPGGALEVAQTAGTFVADEMRITDIDHDGIGDALGLTRTSLLVRRGDPAGQLDQVLSFVTPTQTGPAAFGDLDRDGSLDVTLTTPDGMVSYASGFGELAPLPVNEQLIDQDSMEDLDIRKFFFFGPNVFSGFVVDKTSDATVLLTLDGNASPAALDFSIPCGARIGAITGAMFDDAKVDIYNVSKRSDDVLDAVVSIIAGTGASRKFCVLSLHRDGPNFITGAVPAITVTDITPAGVGVPTSMPVLADIDVDNDPCPGFVTTDGGLSTPMYWEGEKQLGKCVMLPQSLVAPQNPKALPAIPAPPGAKLLGRAPVDPPVLFVASDALITTEGVYPNLFGYYFFGVYHTSRAITQYGTGDLDGDGAIDLVFASGGEEDLDVLFRVGSEAGFNLYRIDTTTAVSRLTVGDYDGNRIDDIAYTEVLDDYERLLVSFGTRDRPLEPVRVGAFNEVLSLDRISFGDSIDVLAVAEDLLVLQPPAPGKTAKRLALLHGSPQRTLLSYFDPRLDNLRRDTLFRGSVIGDFTNDSGTSQYTDLIAIAPAASSSVAGSSVVRAWRVPGTPDGLDGTATAGLMMQGLADCSLGNSSTLCLDVARYLAYPTGEAHDVVIGVDRSQRAIMVDPWATPNPSSTDLTALTGVIPTGTVPKSLYAADLDGDGTRELIVALAPQPGSTATGAVISCTMTNGVADTCEDLVPAIRDAATAAGIVVEQCYDVTVGPLSYQDASTVSTGLDIVVACRGDGTSIFRVHRGTEGQVIDRIASLAMPVSAIRAGDVTGDHIDDLVVVGGDTVSQLVVLQQCTNRDLACIRGGQ